MAFCYSRLETARQEAVAQLMMQIVGQEQEPLTHLPRILPLRARPRVFS